MALSTGTAVISLKNLRISRKLVIGFAAMIAVSAGTGATALINIDIMNKARAQSRESNDADLDRGCTIPLGPPREFGARLDH